MCARGIALCKLMVLFLNVCSSVLIPFGFYRKNLLDARNVQQIGVLAVQFCDWIFELPPRTVTATGEVGDDGSDLSMTAELCFGDNVSATILASAVENLTNRATIVGTNGQITVSFPNEY